jgi:phytoene dehydrogenase-like protein
VPDVPPRSLAEPDAVVVGSGPNGLAAALTLARHGFKVTVLEAADEPGGGTRTYEDPAVPGLLHDHCSTVHATGPASPFFRSVRLERYGLEWCHPEILVAHPLDDGSAPAMYRDLDATADGLGPDGPMWRRLFGPLAARFDEVAPEFLGGLVRIPRHPFAMARTGLPGLLPSRVVAERFATEAAGALFGGVAAHSYTRLEQPITTMIGTVLAAAGHAHGWPFAHGGSQGIWRAMVAMLEDLGSEVVTGVHVKTLSELPRARVALLDVSPTQLAEIAGDHLPARDRQRARRWRYGPAAYKVDFAVRGEVPWTAETARRAGTIHLAGTFEELAAAEAAAERGELPERPFVLSAQPHVADPSRGADGITPFWAYAHVPHACSEDVAPLIEAQIERFAPGFGDRVVARNVTTPADLEAWNPNMHGGDITGGASLPTQLIARPKLSPDPYRTGIPGLFLCSASTPPGGGAHGICGFNAARSALRVLTA